jgi:hypothetical protein
MSPLNNSASGSNEALTTEEAYCFAKEDAALSRARKYKHSKSPRCQAVSTIQKYVRPIYNSPVTYTQSETEDHPEIEESLRTRNFAKAVVKSLASGNGNRHHAGGCSNKTGGLPVFLCEETKRRDPREDAPVLSLSKKGRWKVIEALRNGEIVDSEEHLNGYPIKSCLLEGTLVGSPHTVGRAKAHQYTAYHSTNHATGTTTHRCASAAFTTAKGLSKCRESHVNLGSRRWCKLNTLAARIPDEFNQEDRADDDYPKPQVEVVYEVFTPNTSLSLYEKARTKSKC